MNDLEQQRLLDSQAQSKYVHLVDAEDRRGFIRKVYSLVSVQILATAAIIGCIHVNAEPLWLYENRWLFWLSLVGSLVFLVPLICSTTLARQFPVNFLLLGSFTVCEGICLGFACYLYTGESLAIGAGLTAATFCILTFIAVFTKIDFTRIYPYLIVVSLFLIMGSIVFAFFPQYYQKMQFIFGVIGALLFSLYIVADTQMIVKNDGERTFSIDDYVLAAAVIYIDVIQLFLSLMRLVGERR